MPKSSSEIPVEFTVYFANNRVKGFAQPYEIEFLSTLFKQGKDEIYTLVYQVDLTQRKRRLEIKTSSIIAIDIPAKEGA